MATYKHMNSGSTKSSALSETLLAGNDTALLKQIVADLQDIKGGNIAATPQAQSKDSFKYMDDKTLYSSDG